jgi:RHS repeat-associated protein
VVTAYGYDSAGRLASVTRGASAVTYGYDPNGNRTQLSGVNVATYDAQDRMLAYAANTYEYTAGGNLSLKSSPAGNTQYTYDLYGSLRQATLADGTVLDFLVDGTHRRVGKKRNGVLEHAWLYDGQLRPIAELDGGSNLVSVFMYGEKSNVPEAMTKGGSTYRIVTDHLGSVRLVVDVSTGAVAQALEYDAWGNVTSDTNPGFQPFGFAGGLYDRDLALVRFGARDYDPETGRWTSKDPIRFDGGQTNLYVYARNETVNGSDTTGTHLDQACFDSITTQCREACADTCPGGAFAAACTSTCVLIESVVESFAPGTLCDNEPGPEPRDCFAEAEQVGAVCAAQGHPMGVCEERAANYYARCVAGGAPN